MSQNAARLWTCVVLLSRWYTLFQGKEQLPGIQGPPLSHSHRPKGQTYRQGSEATEGVRQSEWRFLGNASVRVCCELPFAFLSRQKSKASGSLQPRSTRHGLCRASHREFGFSDVDACSCSLDCLPRGPTTYWQARGVPGRVHPETGKVIKMNC